MCVVIVDLRDTSNLFTFDGFGGKIGVGTASLHSAIIETWDWVRFEISGMIGVLFDVFTSKDHIGLLDCKVL